MSLTSSPVWNKMLAAIGSLERTASRLAEERSAQGSGAAARLARARNREAARRLRNVIATLKRAGAELDALDAAGDSHEGEERRHA